jgi:anthranilate synthase component 2
MKTLVLDNYDSFTFNLVQLLRESGCGDLDVIRNNRLTLGDVEKYDRILLSPGPGIPSEAGLMPEIVRTFAGRKSILGICLGHQCIGEIYGGTLVNMAAPVHGKAVHTTVLAKQCRIFRGLPERFLTGRYHSWLVSRENLPGEIEVIAEDDNGAVMGLRHRIYDLFGLQFHPESVLTEYGREMIVNWLAGGGAQ